MNAKDLKVGMIVAIKTHDPYYFPIKGEIKGVSCATPSHPSKSSKAFAHVVELLNGVHKGQTLALVGKRILREWTTDDEANHESMRNFHMGVAYEKAIGDRKRQKEYQDIEKIVTHLDRMGIMAALGTHPLPLSKWEPSTPRNQQVLVVFDVEQLLSIIEKYSLKEIVFDAEGEMNGNYNG